MSQSDIDTMRRAVRGDREALAELLERHGPAVRRRLSGELPRRWQALLSIDDVMQETYTEAFLDIGRLEPDDETSFVAWMGTLAHRNLVDAIRMLEADKRGGDRRKVETADNDASFVALYEYLGGDSSTPSRRVARGEARCILEKAVERLPQAYRLVIRMYDLEGRGVQDVARVCGRSPGAVFMIRARAHRRLRELMGSDSEFFTDSA